MRENGFMSTQIKAVYYPNLYLTLGETRFGSKNLLEPENPYEKPLPRATRKKLIKIDKLVGLKRLWGESILLARANIYAIVSGDVEDDRYRSLMCSYYKTHAAFANYVDSIVVFGSQEVPLIKRFIQQVRKDLDIYSTDVDSYLKSYYGTKFLLEHNEYLYYAVGDNCDYSKLEGVVEIS